LLKRPEVNTPTLIYFHGNAGNIGIRLDVFSEIYFKVKVNILAVDYRGYGCSEGVPSENGFLRDADAVLNYVFERNDLKNAGVFIYGASIGGAVAVYAGEKFQQVGSK
jgi:pimeloyl-ACP methyl ester carboxylesterase